MTTDAEKIEYCIARLERLASCEAFHLSGAVTEETRQRVLYAQDALRALRPEPVSAFAEFKHSQRGELGPIPSETTWNAALAAVFKLDFITICSTANRNQISGLRED